MSAFARSGFGGRLRGSRFEPDSHPERAAVPQYSRTPLHHALTTPDSRLRHLLIICARRSNRAAPACRPVTAMRIAIGADHAGYTLKQVVAEVLRHDGHDVTDLGAHSPDPVDYPDVAEAVALAVRDGLAERAVLVCGSGVGASVAANKVPGIRAAICHDVYSAHQGVEHDDMNVLVLGGRIIGAGLARDLVRAFVAATFSREDRHARRLSKLGALEGKYGNGAGG